MSLLLRLISLLALLSAPLPAAVAQGRGASLIRDAEIEATLRAYANPIFQAAGLNPNTIHIFIVQDDSINAFVAGGANIFLHTGLIEATKNPGMLLGVIAHETGHIAGGHLARGTEKLKNAQLGILLGYVLGAAAAASGNADAGMAVMSGSEQAFRRNFLSFTRANEQAADQAALTYLDRLGISSAGMLQMFETLRRQEIQRFGVIDPYAITHPLSIERITHVRAHVNDSPLPQDSYPGTFDHMHKRMVAKLHGFLDTSPQTLARYAASDKSLPARMARAIAYFRTPDPQRALAEMQALLTEHPDDAFLLDLKGQILFESGNIPEALASYGKAAAMMPDSSLILTALGEAQLAEGSMANLQKAAASLEKAAGMDSSYARIWRLLATAHGRLGNKGQAALALAEEAALLAEPEVCARQAALALEHLPQDAPARLRAEDVKARCDQLRQQKEERE